MNRQFYEEKYKNRIVTCLDWSKNVRKFVLNDFIFIYFFWFKYPELLLASYENGIYEDADGVALIWNLKFDKSTPEYTFNCSVSILEASNIELKV